MSNYKAIVVGGSAGSFPLVIKLLQNLKKDYRLPIFLCLHRLKHVRHGFMEALNVKSVIPLREPDDKEKIKDGVAYLAPSNYHMFVELGHNFALSTDDMVKFSRPSIDLTYDTASYVYREKMVSIIVSGANTDGAEGMYKAHKRGAFTIVQEPAEASVKTMPEGALKLFEPNKIMKMDEIISFVNSVG